MIAMRRCFRRLLLAGLFAVPSITSGEGLEREDGHTRTPTQIIGSVSGQLADALDGSGIGPPAEVYLYRCEDFECSSSDWKGYLYPDEHGAFRFEDPEAVLEPGTYWLRAYAEGYTPATTLQFDVAESEDAYEDIALTPLGIQSDTLKECEVLPGGGCKRGLVDDSSTISYRYVPLDEGLPPDILFFDVLHISDKGRIVGTGWACPENCYPAILEYKKGRTSVVRDNAIAYAANEIGSIGGSILTDPDAFIEQAAIIRGKKVKLIPPLPGEFKSHVSRISDSDIALVESYSATYERTRYLYDNGKITQLNFGAYPAEQAELLDINKKGLISGTFFSEANRAFRMDPASGVITILDPLPTEPDSWAMGIDKRGAVLGYSFIPGALERIGVWGKDNVFRTFFVEGTPEFPTVSNTLLWNEKGTIVITNSRNDLNSYVVPRPGVRLNLADLVVAGGQLPAWTLIKSLNKHGDMIGMGGPQYFWSDATFLLERIDDDHEDNH